MSGNNRENSGIIPEHAVLVADQNSLAALMRQLGGRPWLAMDTEFMRERSYYPQLCLVQIADSQQAVCIDVLAIKDLSPLRALLEDEKVTKVFHAAGQDLEVLYQATHAAPRPIFDTQVAAALLGHPDQIGYARLVEALLGVSLAKTHTRSDWSRRPLDAQALAYAVDDVRYLAQIYPRLRAQLEDRERLGWLDGEFARMTNSIARPPDPEQAWRRLKAVNRLPAGAQRTLARLAAWRERMAMAADRPRGWIIKDDVLLELARHRPADESALARVRGLPDGVRRKHGEALLECMQAAAQADNTALATPPPALDAEQSAVVDLLMTGLRARAAEMEIAPAILASRRELEALVAGNQDVPLLQGWRRVAAGEAMLDLLAGKLALRAQGSGVWIERPE